MKNTVYHCRYPFHIILLSSLQSAGIYFIALFIVFNLYIWLSIPMLLYILFLEFRLLRNSCTKCYYYGKNCAFGKGKISSLFFKKKDALIFGEACITWKSMIPELLVTAIPLLVGIYLLITDFSWLVLVLLLMLLLLSSIGNSFIRGKLACNHCQQRELGCAAWELFNTGN